MQRTGRFVWILEVALCSALPASGAHRLIVDDDRAQCRDAEFTSIQAAVEAAVPGQTILVCPGTYREQVTIRTDNLRLIARGRRGAVQLRGEVEKPEYGFHILGAFGVRIEGFDIRLFHESGILIEGGGDNRIRNNVTAVNSHDGIQLIGSFRNLIEHNETFGNSPQNPMRACGIQILEGPNSDFNEMRHNLSYQNAFGIRLENGNWNVLFDNDTSHNRRFGIWNRNGANQTVIENNRAFDNVGQEGNGIAVTGSTEVTVENNRAFGNALDLRWDEEGDNRFEDNHCKTSVPPGLCQHFDK